MKKSLLLLSIAFSYGISFAGIDVKDVKLSDSSSLKAFPSQIIPNLNAPHTRAGATVEDYLGVYRWVNQDPAEEDSPYYQGDVVLVKGSAENEVLIYGINMFTDTPIKATIDPAQGTVSIPSSQSLGFKVQGYDIVFAHLSVNNNNDFILDNSPYEATIDGINFVFDSWDFMGIGAVVGNVFNFLSLPDGTDYVWFSNILSHRSEPTSEGWTDAGTATIDNAWFKNMPGLGVEKEPYEVTYQTFDQDKTLIRLLNPYGEGTPYESVNMSNVSGAIYLDISNPNCIGVIRAHEEDWATDMSTGEVYYCWMGYYPGFFNIETDYNYPQSWYPGNQAGYFMEDGMTPDELITDSYRDFELSTMKDNVITINDAIFGVSLNIRGIINGWNTGTSDIEIGTPVITLHPGSAGVGEIKIDENAPVKYYNLQGMEIANPEKGQLVIKKQGNSVSKFIAR